MLIVKWIITPIKCGCVYVCMYVCLYVLSHAKPLWKWKYLKSHVIAHSNRLFEGTNKKYVRTDENEY